MGLYLLGRGDGSGDYHADRGYGQDGVEPALNSRYAFILANEEVVECPPPFQRLKELAAS
ncbi:MAG: hypothetical protein ACRERE_45660 [Candidatus Entotheonellia bacterium]